MRTPTPIHEAISWWHEALAHPYLIDSVPMEPQSGFYKRRLVRGGVYVPAKIWLDAEVDAETGELLSDEKLLCEVGGNFADAEDQWTYLASNPIGEAEFKFLTALRQHCAWHEPDQPHANPKRTIDWLAVSPPQFQKGTPA